MTSLIYYQSTLVIAAVVLTALVLAIEVGFRIGCRYEGRFNDPARGHINAIQASMLGMVALLLAFTFSRSLERFRTRSEAVVDEANAIGTAYLRAQLLPPSVGEPTQQVLRDYVDLRVEAAGKSYEKLDMKLIRRRNRRRLTYGDMRRRQPPGRSLRLPRYSFNPSMNSLTPTADARQRSRGVCQPLSFSYCCPRLS
jgi:hypothetical protein